MGKKRQLAICFPVAQKKMRARLDGLKALMKAAQAEVYVDSPGEDPEDEVRWTLVRVHGLVLATALYESSLVAEWSDGTSTPILAGDLLDTVEQRDMLVE